MPYFVFHLGALNVPELVATEPRYRDARNRMRSRREAEPDEPADRVRMVFAENEIEAIDLLLNPRPRDPALDAEDG